MQRPWLAFGAAFLFHFLADTFLHWNIYTDRHRWAYAWAAADVAGGLLLAYGLMPDRFFSAPVLAAMLGGNLPDIFNGVRDLRQKLRDVKPPVSKGWFFRFHEAVQLETLRPARGLAWQVVFAAVAVWILQK